MTMKRITTILFLLLASIYAQAFTLVIDPGHGGKDAGAIGKNSKEKDINLAVALAFGEMVKANFPDVKVIFTRKTDVFVELSERANIANKAKADLFVSIHTNSLPKGRISRGTETYTLGMHKAAENLEVAKRENSVITLESNYKTHYEGFDPSSSESYIIFEFMQDQYMASSVDFARMIQKQFATTAKRINKGVHQAGFLVLREVSMPSVLIELGFINNRQEEKYLASDWGQKQLAKSIYNAFQAYYKKNR
jgi:N-acetylmuramoyl-L-alanine amidase